MAFIVEMSWGRAHEYTAMEFDEARGELVAGERIVTGPPDPERRTFSCHSAVWSQLLELGRAHGWIPAGAVRSGEPFGPTRHDAGPDVEYRPECFEFRQVHGEDAAAWAMALERALRESS